MSTVCDSNILVPGQTSGILASDADLNLILGGLSSQAKVTTEAIGALDDSQQVIHPSPVMSSESSNTEV